MIGILIYHVLIGGLVLLSLDSAFNLMAKKDYFDNGRIKEFAIEMEEEITFLNRIFIIIFWPFVLAIISTLVFACNDVLDKLMMKKEDMNKLTQWQREYVEKIEAMSNAELLDEVLDRADEWQEPWGDEWKYKACQLHLRMRLIDWLNEKDD